MALNLDSSSPLALEEQASVQLTHPSTGELLFDEEVAADGTVTKLPVMLFISGRSSKLYRSEVLKMQNRNAKLRAGKTVSAEKADEDWKAMVVKLSHKITNLDYKGAPCDNPTTIQALYEDLQFSWVYDQANEAIGNVDDFLAQ